VLRVEKLIKSLDKYIDLEVDLSVVIFRVSWVCLFMYSIYLKSIFFTGSYSFVFCYLIEKKAIIIGLKINWHSSCFDTCVKSNLDR